MRMQNIENGENQNVEDTKPKESGKAIFFFLTYFLIFSIYPRFVRNSFKEGN